MLVFLCASMAFFGGVQSCEVDRGAQFAVALCLVSAHKSFRRLGTALHGLAFYCRTPASLRALDACARCTASLCRNALMVAILCFY